MYLFALNIFYTTSYGIYISAHIAIYFTFFKLRKAASMVLTKSRLFVRGE